MGWTWAGSLREDEHLRLLLRCGLLLLLIDVSLLVFVWRGGGENETINLNLRGRLVCNMCRKLSMQFVFQLTRSASNLFVRKLNYLMKREKSAANKLKSATGQRWGESEKKARRQAIKTFCLSSKLGGKREAHPPTRPRRLSSFSRPKSPSRCDVKRRGTRFAARWRWRARDFSRVSRSLATFKFFA